MLSAVFSFRVPNLSSRHEEAVRQKLTAVEISGQPAHQHIHLAPLFVTQVSPRRRKSPHKMR